MKNGYEVEEVVVKVGLGQIASPLYRAHVVHTSRKPRVHHRAQVILPVFHLKLHLPTVTVARDPPVGAHFGAVVGPDHLGFGLDAHFVAERLVEGVLAHLLLSLVELHLDALEQIGRDLAREQGVIKLTDLQVLQCFLEHRLRRRPAEVPERKLRVQVKTLSEGQHLVKFDRRRNPQQKLGQGEPALRSFELFQQELDSLALLSVAYRDTVHEFLVGR